MECFTELTPPTAVTHAVCAPFLSPTATNVILARTSLLQIFGLKTLSTELDTTVSVNEDARLTDRRMLDDDGLDQSFLGADVTYQRAERSHSSKLVLIAEYPLSGTVTALAPIKILTSKTGADALLIATKDAKLSLVEWDPDCHAITTISIHYYESEDLQVNPWSPDLAQCVSELSVDPSSRCAALKFGRRNLAILPFRQAGDDLVMGDDDLDMDEDEDEDRPVPKDTRADGHSTKTPYAASFVLPLSALDPSLVHPIHLSFLHEYREPTFGILAAPRAASSALLHERRDLLSYTVFTLDLEQRASTTILSVTDLPYDLYQVVALPTPVGGALLLGVNELIHVDQAGKTNGVAVNPFARECSSFGMADQSDLSLKLEGCVLEQLSPDTGDMLLILASGALAMVTFRLDGRSVSGLSVRTIADESGARVVPPSVSCAASLGRGKMFLGSEEADAVVLGWSRKSKQTAKSASRLGASEEEAQDESYFDEDAIDDQDDDLYADGDGGERQQLTTPSGDGSTGELTFRIHDALPNLAPMKGLTFGLPTAVDTDQGLQDDAISDVELITTSGCGRTGSLTILRPEIYPKVIQQHEFPDVQGIWSVAATRPVVKSRASQAKANAQVDLEQAYAVDDALHRFLIVSRATAQGGEESMAYTVTSTGFDEIKGTEFEPAAGGTVDVGSLGARSRIIQVLRGEIRSYDGDLGLAQIFPISDEVSGAEPKALSTSFCDPYLVVVRDDASLLLLECDGNGDLEEMDKGPTLSVAECLSACLYRDRDGQFAASGQQAKEAKDRVVMFLLTTEGALQIYELPDLSQPKYLAECLGILPAIIATEHAVKKSTARENLTEIVVADLGEGTMTSPYLLVRDAADNLTIYEPFYATAAVSAESFPPSLRLLKISNPTLASAAKVSGDSMDDEEHRARPMRVVSDVGGYRAVFLPGDSPSFVLKGAASIPRVMRLRGPGVRGMSGFHTEGCERGWVYVDVKGVLRVSQFPTDVRYTELGWAMKRVVLGEEVHAISYHEAMHSYVVGTSQPVEFAIPKDDEFHREWADENISLKPTVEQGAIKLLNPITWGVVHTYPLHAYETVLCIKTLSLEVSENTRARKTLVAVGTSIGRMTDQACRGAIYIFEIIRVVPVPGQPETDRHLKLVVREEVKGAVTAISEIGCQGFLLMAQGQKCLVRGLKEDGTLLPVAFMDVMCHVSALKNLPGTGMCLIGDALKGEEPYKMILFGKSGTHLEVIGVEFLPSGDQLYIVVADADSNLHLFQFDPEHPRSLSGSRLLHHTTFNVGSYTTNLTRIPTSSFSFSTSSSTTNTSPTTPSQILHTSHSGALSLLSPLSETTYRTLSSLWNQISNSVDHHAGLNPRSYRSPSSFFPSSSSSSAFTHPASFVALGGLGSAGVAMGGAGGGSGGGGEGRSVLDGAVLRRWGDLSAPRRAEVVARLGLGDGGQGWAQGQAALGGLLAGVGALRLRGKW
ncbi:MAG: mRNA cleavage and polyadenylation factor subunit [Thelocarpon superellum]|nr:MAG: mRNA cleavage and polyadenylation factor subunit [Thelocarpon superellum]